MTRSIYWKSDHPSVITKAGHCSRCHEELDWRLLEPFILPNERIQMLCPSCRMERQSRVCDED